jgi:hypothetical protein
LIPRTGRARYAELFGAVMRAGNRVTLVEGIMYLTMPEQEFHRVHGSLSKPWF